MEIEIKNLFSLVIEVDRYSTWKQATDVENTW